MVTIILCNSSSLNNILPWCLEYYVEDVLSKSGATRTLGDLLSLRHPMKTLMAALYGDPPSFHKKKKKKKK
jgi:hypothetical protein